MMISDGKERPEGSVCQTEREKINEEDMYVKENENYKHDKGENPDEYDQYDDYKGISYGVILKKVVRRCINDWCLFCERVDNDNGENYHNLRSALIQYCRHMRECFLKVLELDAFRKYYKEINEIVKELFEYRESYKELKTKYQYELYLCKLKLMNLQINENNILCALDVLATGTYTRFPTLFKEILSNPTDSFIPNLNVNEINILKKRIVDEFLINYYSSRIPKNKVNFIFSDGFIELDIINEVKVSFITDFVTWNMVKADISFLNQMNLHSSHNANLINLLTYAVMQKLQEYHAPPSSRTQDEAPSIDKQFRETSGEKHFDDANGVCDYDKMHILSKSIDSDYADQRSDSDYADQRSDSDYADQRSDSDYGGQRNGSDYSDQDNQNHRSDDDSGESDDFLLQSEKKSKYKQKYSSRMGRIEQHYHKEMEKRTKREELPCKDILYEIYKVSHFYCNVQIMEFFKGCINQYNSFNYRIKKFYIFKKFRNNTVEVTPSCYNYNMSDKEVVLHLDIHLHEFELSKGIYEFFEKIPLHDKNNEKKIILKFVLNNANGNINVFLWPFSFFKKEKKEKLSFDSILSYYEYIFCHFLKKRMKKLFVFDPHYIHLENWLARVSNCVTCFLFSILKEFSIMDGVKGDVKGEAVDSVEESVDGMEARKKKHGKKKGTADFGSGRKGSLIYKPYFDNHARGSETSFENNTIGIHELIQDYFFDLSYIREQIRSVNEHGMKKKGKNIKGGEKEKNLLQDKEKEAEEKLCNVGRSNHFGNLHNNKYTTPLTNRIKIIRIKKRNWNSYLLKYIFYEQKIQLFLNRQSEKFIFMCNWNKAFINVISLNYDLKLMIYVIYILKRFSLYVYMYNELKERLIKIKAGRFFNFEFANDEFCPCFHFYKLKLHDFLKKYDYSSNIVLTKFLQSFFSFIDFYFYLPYRENFHKSHFSNLRQDVIEEKKSQEFETYIRELIKKGDKYAREAKGEKYTEDAKEEKYAEGAKEEKYTEDAKVEFDKPNHMHRTTTGSSKMGRNNHDERSHMFEMMNLGSSQQKFEGNIPNESNYHNMTEKGGEKETQDKFSFRKNFVTILYFTIYTYDNTPLLLCMMIERDYIFHTYIVISFENKKIISEKNKTGTEQKKNKKGKLFFTIPLIHRTYPIGENIKHYLNSVRDLVNIFSNMFSNLSKILQMNYKCAVFSNQLCFSSSKGGSSYRITSFQRSKSDTGVGKKVEGEKSQTKSEGESTIRLGYDKMYFHLRKERKKNFLDLQYFINKKKFTNEHTGQDERSGTKEKYPHDYISNYMLHLSCAVDEEEYYLSKEYMNSQVKNKFSFLIRIHTSGSFFFKIPLRCKRFMKIKNLNVLKNNDVSFLCANVVINAKIQEIKMTQVSENQSDISKANSNGDDTFEMGSEGEKERTRVSKEINSQHEKTSITKDWVQLKKMYVVMKDECSPKNILYLFSVLSKIFSVMNIFTELYCLEKILSSDIYISNCHLMNISVIHHCGYNREIACSVNFNILSNDETLTKGDGDGGFTSIATCNKQQSEKSEDSYNVTLDKEKKNNFLACPIRTNNNKNLMNKYKTNGKKYSNYENWDEENLIEKLLYIDISFNSPYECINKLFLREKKNFDLYIKKKKSIFRLLKFIFLTFEFHYNFHILINNTSNHLNKINFLHQMNFLHHFDFHYVNLLTVILAFKSFKNEKKNGLLSFYIILHPEHFSKILIIPHYDTVYMNKHHTREVSIKKFFKKGRHLFRDLEKINYSPFRRSPDMDGEDGKRDQVMLQVEKQTEEGTKNSAGKSALYIHSWEEPRKNNHRQGFFPDFEKHVNVNSGLDRDQTNDPTSDPTKHPTNDPNSTSFEKGTGDQVHSKRAESYMMYRMNNRIPPCNRIKIDHMDEEELFIYLFLQFCDIINLKSTNSCANYPLSHSKYSNNVHSSGDNDIFLENTQEDKIFGDGIFMNDLKIFEEYDMFILNIKYLFKIKNQIVLSEIFFVPPIFLYTTLYTLVDHIRTLKYWILLIYELRVHYSDITLTSSEIDDVFQYVTAVRKPGTPTVTHEKPLSKGTDEKTEETKNEGEVNAVEKMNSTRDGQSDMNNQREGKVANMNTYLKEGSEHGENGKNGEIFIHLVWFMYSTKDFHLDTLSFGECKNHKRNYEYFLCSKKEVISEHLYESSNDPNTGQHKKIKKSEEDGNDSMKGNSCDKIKSMEETQNGKYENVRTSLIKTKREQRTTNEMGKEFVINKMNLDKLKYMVNAYSHMIDDIFLKEKSQKILLGKDFIKKAYALRNLELKSGNVLRKRRVHIWDEKKNTKVDNTYEEEKVEFDFEIGSATSLKRKRDTWNGHQEEQNDFENIFFFNDEKVLNMDKNNCSITPDCSGENTYKWDMHYLTNSIGVYFENVGENVDEQDSWFYYVRRRRGNHNQEKERKRNFILAEENILKINSKINSALNIIYKYIRIWLLKMKHISVISFFRVINDIITDKKKIFELSSLLFNCVLSYQEHLQFWMFRNKENLLTPFVETEFLIEGIGEPAPEDVLYGKEAEKASMKWIELVVPLLKDVQENYLIKHRNNNCIRTVNPNCERDAEACDQGPHTDDLEIPSREKKNIVVGRGNGNSQEEDCHSNFTNDKMISINYKMWRYMPFPFKKNIYKQEFPDILNETNESVPLTFKIPSLLQIKNLKEVYINNEQFVKFLMNNKIDLNIAHQRVMKILQKYNLMANYSLVATQTILHSSTFELLLKGKNSKTAEDSTPPV
ncbi:Cg2 protein [Plasmodium gonderi]|uniref:Mediator of RNA polymerase II transcription subunit 14 n=1 Tax=Plasmodium gonderi TaxID=77519 RepID=A0A1Y1J8U0_PLAGO|nr:Cg2 protein [Plasmodium gonderi]GAW78929.1 Cg2 protein [Plasmodium gonderi]